MRLTSFRVKGFKNFTEEVKLEGLGTVNVIHGANNVGKSNLLQAMQVFFRLLGLDIDQGGWLPISTPRRLIDADFEKLGFPANEIFNIRQPALPIEMTAELSIDEEELTKYGIKPLFDCRSVRIATELRWEGTHAGHQIRGFVFADGTDAVAVQESAEKKAWVLRFAGFLARSFLVKVESNERFALVEALRPIDHELALKLYDAKESTEIESFRRWERFVETMGLFSDILGEGSFMVVYDRQASQANLVYQTQNGRIPLWLLGSGVQQIVNLLGHLLMTSASLVALEEPEINLKYDLQERLREVLAEIVGSLGGPSQLFLTSHSPAFESSPYFYLMRADPQGPVVERIESSQALIAVGFPEEVTNLPQHAALSFVSTDGVVRLHHRVLEALGLPHGGGVMFIDGDRCVEMMSDSRFIERFGLGGDHEGQD